MAACSSPNHPSDKGSRSSGDRHGGRVLGVNRCTFLGEKECMTNNVGAETNGASDRRVQAGCTACLFSLSSLGWRVDGGFGLRRIAGYLYVHDPRVQPPAYKIAEPSPES